MNHNVDNRTFFSILFFFYKILTKETNISDKSLVTKHEKEGTFGIYNALKVKNESDTLTLSPASLARL